MSCILNIDTSTNVCSVAVSQDGGCIFEKEDHSGPNHAEQLGTFVDQALSFIDNHAYTYAKTRVRAWTAADCHRIKWYCMIVNE